jgi:hypothetical protein
MKPNIESLQVAADVLAEGGFVTSQLAEDGELVIVALDRGWVVVGRWHKIGGMVQMEGASVIERWGTSEGLAQLAQDGPTPNTKLSRAGVIRFAPPSGLPLWPCNEEAWR